MCPRLQGATFGDWHNFKSEIRAYTANLPENGRKFILLGGASYVNALISWADYAFAENDTTFEELLLIIEHRILIATLANLDLL